jgi:hypothetical protein
MLKYTVPFPPTSIEFEQAGEADPGSKADRNAESSADACCRKEHCITAIRSAKPDTEASRRRPGPDECRAAIPSANGNETTAIAAAMENERKKHMAIKYF